MSHALGLLLGLKRAAEKEAQETWVQAAATRARADEELARLAASAERARQFLAGEKSRLGDAAPIDVGSALGRERYLVRLTLQVRQTFDRVRSYEENQLAQARALEDTAAERYRVARQQREVVDALLAREEAQRLALAERRAEDSAADLAQSLYLRGRR